MRIGTYIDIPAAVPPKPIEPTVFVAAYNARPEVKEKADIVCEGANDDLKIEEAISMLPEGGGRVFLSEGEFILGSSINISKSNVTLEGCGPGTLIKGAIYGAYIAISGLSNIKISNLRIDGTGQLSGFGIDVRSCSNVEISSCIIEKTINHAIYSEYSSHLKIVKNLIRNCPHVLYGYQISKNIISNNVLISNGIWLDGSDQNVISSNYIYGASFGIQSYTGSSNSIHGNVIVEALYDGILIYYGRSNIIIGNCIYLCRQIGIMIHGSSNNVISSNTLLDNGQEIDQFADIHIVNAENNIISNNTILATQAQRTYYGIIEEGDWNVISNNFVSGQTIPIVVKGLNSVSLNNIVR
jgi:Nitrous oxidase accessory protein